jgi:cellulase/cellobiase CelA1
MLLRSSRRARSLLALAGVGAVVAAVIIAIPTTAHAAVVCNVTYQTNSWTESPGAGGFTANITINNVQDPVNGWSLAFTLPSGQTITSGWNASFSPRSGQVAATNVGYNGTIAPNGSVGIGFQATHTGNSAEPSAFTLNGASCAVV